MEYTKALKQRDRLELELKGLIEKVTNSKKIKISLQSWYNKKEDEYRKFLSENGLEPISITLQ